MFNFLFIPLILTLSTPILSKVGYGFSYIKDVASKDANTFTLSFEFETKLRFKKVDLKSGLEVEALHLNKDNYIYSIGIEPVVSYSLSPSFCLCLGYGYLHIAGNMIKNDIPIDYELENSGILIGCRFRVDDFLQIEAEYEHKNLYEFSLGLRTPHSTFKVPYITFVLQLGEGLSIFSTKLVFQR